MKKHLSIVLTIALMVVVAFGCKVGPDDPASMASRDGRLIGTWKLTGLNYFSTNINFFGTQTSTWTYDGTILTKLDSPGGSTTVSFALEIVIDKNGVLTCTETEDGDVTLANTYWEWMNDDQNKSQLYLNGGGTMVGGYWMVNRLASKELILESYFKSATTSSGTTDSYEETTTLTFTAQ